MTRIAAAAGMNVIERLAATGIRRKGAARTGFRYVGAGRDGTRAATLERIRALRLPPAWRDVIINPSPTSRIQAVGRDAAGRWQYVYHPAHVRRRERQKYRRLVRFGAALPALRRAVARDLRMRELTKAKVLATIIRILACAFIRPGSEEYAAENGSFGIATLRRKHVEVRGDTVYFDFPAKSRKRQRRTLRDPIVARVVKRLLALPGYEVFKFVDEYGKIVDIKRADINAYIKQHMGEAFSAKDFRTWTGTLLCASLLASAGAVNGDRKTSKKRVVVAVRATAEQLGNTPAVCRSAYISPSVLRSYERGLVIDRHLESAEDVVARRVRGLHDAERALLRLLQRTAQP